MNSDKSIAKRSDWLDLQTLSIKDRLRIMKNVHRLEDFRPSLKKLIFGSAVDRYSEFFKSHNTPDPVFSESSGSGGKA